MSDPILLIEFLRKAVPGAYLLMCLYIGFVGYRTVVSWVYLLLFGLFGISSYMLLNEPLFNWLPLWITYEHWYAAALIGILLVGVALFTLAIETQDLDWPWERVRKWNKRLRSYLQS